MALIETFLRKVKSAYDSGDGDRLALVFVHASQGEEFWRLKDELSGRTRNLSDLCARHLPGGDSDRFATLLTEYLTFIAEQPVPLSSLLQLEPEVYEGGAYNEKGKGRASIGTANGSGAGAGTNECDWARYYDAWATVYTRAASVFALPDTVWFIPSLRYFGTTLVALAINVDKALNDPRKAKTTDAAGKLSKSAGVAAVDRAQTEQSKRLAALMLANLSFKAYFKLNNVRLCETVIGSVDNARKLNRDIGGGGLTGDEIYWRADRVTYKYYLGRLRLFQHRVRLAASELRWAFDNCTNAQFYNKRLILIFLITANLILGIYPSASLLEAFDLYSQFGELVQCLRLGYAARCLGALDNWMDWHRKRGTYLLLREKIQVGLWRNLMRRSLLISRIDMPPSNAPPTLRLSLLLATARYAWNDPTLTLDDAECICVSLLDQGYIKAYILHSKGVLVLQKGQELGFPPMASVV